MKKITNNSRISTTVLILLLSSLSAMIVALPAANAHDPAWQIPTYAYINISPDPIGVGQQLNVHMWINFVPPTASAQYGDRWQNFKYNVTDPEGIVTTLGPFTSDAAGAIYTHYTPDKIGTYNFVFWFPGQTIEGANPAPGVPPFGGTANPQTVGDYYQPSTSETVSVTVQEEQIPYYPSNPLPTEYWSRPVQSVNNQWHTLTGNWFGLKAAFGGSSGMYNATSNFNPYTTAPNTGHIMWTKPLAAGGLMGGEYGGTEQSNFYSTSQYENKFCPIIMNGILYYTSYPGSSTNTAGWVAVDIQTGETLWTKDTTAVLRCGQILDFLSPNQFGGIPYLWATSGGGFAGGGKLMMFDAFTGNWILNVTDSHVGGFIGSANALDDSGNLLVYYLNSTNAPVAATSLSMWNSTKAIQAYSGGGPLGGAYSWRPPQGIQIPWEAGVEWSVNVPLTITQLDGSEVPISPPLSISGGVSQIANGVIIMNNIGNGAWQPGWTAEAGFSASDGSLLWGPINRTQEVWTSILPGAAGNGVYTEYTRELRTWSGYSLTTGDKLWGPTEPTPDAWAFYDWWSSIYAYGNLYAWTLGGYVYCYDIETGNLLWEWNTGSSGYESPYGSWALWVFNSGSIADGKIYVEGGHQYNPPLYKGAKVYCLNATTGELIFEQLGFYVANPPAISDGYMLMHNAYDNQIYAYGKGPSKTTITAPNSDVTTASQVTITGSVTDISAGAQQKEVAANFPNGLPCISDENMSSFMEAVYMQQLMPSDLTGVEVRIQVIDPNGQYAWIGTTYSDSNGNYGYSFIPQTKGMYTIIASFVGSESYYGSSQTTYMTVGDAPAPYPTYPGYQGPSAQEVANSVVANLPADATPQQVADAVVNAMPEYPEPQEVTIPEYTTIDILLIILVAIAIIIGLVCIMMLRKK